MKKAKKNGNSIEANIQDIEGKLTETVKSTENLPNEVLLLPLVQPVEPNKQLLELIEKQISEKEKELECPVCLEVVGAPIFMCSELHLICMNCRPKVKNVLSVGLPMLANLRGIIYAEKKTEELIRLQNQRNLECLSITHLL